MRHLLAAGAAAAALAFGGSAQATTYIATLNGATENPAVPTTATGTATVNIDAILNIMTVSISFTGLTTPASASHIHCCVAAPGNAGVATTTPSFPGFPNATSGTYNNTFDLTQSGTYNPAFVTANGGTPASAENALLAGLAAGHAYLNIHSTMFPGGEIRGYLIRLPEPGTWALLTVGFGLVGAALRRRRLAAAWS
jgi:hypothetical protein